MANRPSILRRGHCWHLANLFYTNALFSSVSGGKDFACSQVVVVKIDALSSHLGSPLEQSLLLLSEKHVNPWRWQLFHLKTDGTNPVCCFPGANLEPEAHMERFCRRVKAAGGGHGQEAPGALAGDGPLSGMRKICVQTHYQLLCGGLILFISVNPDMLTMKRALQNSCILLGVCPHASTHILSPLLFSPFSLQIIKTLRSAGCAKWWMGCGWHIRVYVGPDTATATRLGIAPWRAR